MTHAPQPRILSRLGSTLEALAHPSPPAFLLGALCFAAALTPSLIPRAGLLQGLLAGASFAAGYLVGAIGLLLWRMLHLPEPRPEQARIPARVIGVIGIGVMLWALANASAWQQELHQTMGLPQVESARPLTIGLTALITALVLVLLGRLFRTSTVVLARRLTPWMPDRLAMLTGFALVLAAFSIIGNDVLLRFGLNALDRSYRAVDQALPSLNHLPMPDDPLRSGSSESLMRWKDLGAEGRARVVDPLDRHIIADITGSPAMEPLRIYVGLGSAETPEERAQLALAEAIRTGAFERETMVITTPTGTGWMDPAAMVPLEVLTGGNVATIAVQYSYLPSWLALLTVPEYGVETARATFVAIHQHWAGLPEAKRPKLYLFGLSLGSMNSDLSADMFDIIAAPYQGALWVGPPFTSRSWKQITAGRHPDSPAWLPRFRDGSVVRFMNQDGMPDANLPWGPMRIVYLQYASDPIVFFSPSILWREPDWMKTPRGPGVIESFRWIPLVTFLQTGFDVMTATTTPKGHGHVYDARDYTLAWIELLGPLSWSGEVMRKLHAYLDQRNL